MAFLGRGQIITYLGQFVIPSVDSKHRVFVVFVPVIKISDKNNLKEGKFILGYCFGDLGNGGLTSLIWAQGEAEHHGRREWWRSTAPLFLVARRQREEGATGKMLPSRAAPRDPPPPAMPYLPTVTFSLFKLEWAD